MPSAGPGREPSIGILGGFYAAYGILWVDNSVLRIHPERRGRRGGCIRQHAAAWLCGLGYLQIEYHGVVVRSVADFFLGGIGGYHFLACEFDGILYEDEFPRPAVGDHEAVNSAAGILDSSVLRDLGYCHPWVPALHEKILCTSFRTSERFARRTDMTTKMKKYIVNRFVISSCAALKHRVRMF